MATQVASYIYNFADKKQPWNSPTFHRLTRQLIGINAAHRHLSFFIALSAFRQENPLMRLPIQCCQFLIVPRGGCMPVDPTRGKTMRQESPESEADGGRVSNLGFANVDRNRPPKR